MTIEGWQGGPLSDFLSLRTYGFTNPMPTTSSGPFLLTAKDIRGGQIDYASARHTSKEAFSNNLTDKSRPRVGDVLLTKDGSIGRVAVCDRDDVCINQSVALLRPNAKITSAFLSYLLQAPAYQERMERDSDGSTIKHIYITRVDKMPVLVPGVFEQRAIVEVLGALDAKIAANSRLIATADELCATLMKDALDPPARSSLSSIATLTMGSSPVGSSLNEAGQGSVFYQGVRDFGVRYPKNRVWTSSPVRFAEANDSLLSVRAPVGRVNLASEGTCIGRGLAAVRSRFGRPYSLFHLLRSAPEIWEPFEAEGTVFGSINKSQLESIVVPTIKMARSEELENDLAQIELEIAATLRETDILTATRDALLPQLMSGKLRVKDAEKTLEGVL